MFYAVNITGVMWMIFYCPSKQTLSKGTDSMDTGILEGRIGVGVASG